MPYDHLKEDVKLLLEGMEGKISKVVVIKLYLLNKRETEIQVGFVEMWCLIAGHARIEGGKRVIFLILSVMCILLI